MQRCNVDNVGREDYKGRLALKSCQFGVSSHPLMWPYTGVGTVRLAGSVFKVYDLINFDSIFI